MESARHLHVRSAGPPSDSQGQQEGQCRFVSSQGGTQHCRNTPYLAGFCRFHHRCLVGGEISPLGKILDRVKDQARRREINSHGQEVPVLGRLDDDPITGKTRN
jgi:hypothetical protein